jgi:hypothetical protein
MDHDWHHPLQTQQMHPMDPVARISGSIDYKFGPCTLVGFELSLDLIPTQRFRST